MLKTDDKNITISISVKSKMIDEILTKKYFQKVPMSDDDYLYTLFAFGIWKSKSDYNEFNLFKQMLLDMGKVTEIEL